jgi:acetyl esterase/lipase
MIGKAAQVLSFVSAVVSSLTLLRLRHGFLDAALWFPKVTVGAWTPVLVLAGILGALLGVTCPRRTRWWDPLAPVAGLFGATLAMRYIIKVTSAHDAFEEAFGPDWPARIPAELRLLPRRYPPPLLRAPQVRRRCNLVYATHTETGEPLQADLWLPPAGVPPTGLGLIYVFGGAWHYMNKNLWTGHILRHLAGQGHVVMNIEYTLAPKAQLPGMVADVKRAVGWLKANGVRYGVNPERIVLMGCSSGAHMALLAAYTPGHPAFQPAELEADTSVRAVISDSGFPDLRSAYVSYQEMFGAYFKGTVAPERWFLRTVGWVFRLLRLLPRDAEITVPRDLIPSVVGGTPDQVPERYRLGSPIEHVGPHCPPTLLIQGAHDYSGMLPDVVHLHRSLRAAGVTSVYVEYPEADHGFSVIAAGAARWAPAIQAVLYDVERFLALMV